MSELLLVALTALFLLVFVTLLLAVLRALLAIRLIRALVTALLAIVLYRPMRNFVTARWPDPSTSMVDLGFPRTR